MPTPYQDVIAGNVAQQYGPKQISYPFAENGDYYSQVITRPMIQLASAFSPIAQNRVTTTNLITRSEEFDNGSWVKSATTVLADATESPTRVVNADKIQEDSSSAIHLIYNDVTVIAGQAYTLAAFFKASERSYIQMYAATAGPTSGGYANFDLLNGVVTGQASFNGGVINALRINHIYNGWYQCVLTVTPSSGTTLRFHAALTGNSPNPGGLLTYTGTAGSGVFAFGATVVAGSTLGAYVKTVASSASLTTPVADVENSLAFLVRETDPTVDNGAYRWNRIYAMVPSAQVEYGSYALALPSFPASSFPSVFGAYKIFQPDSSSRLYDAYRTVLVTADTGVPSFYPTGGTYTLTFAGSTTGAIAYNANAATVQTAFNALSPVSNRGSAVVSGSYNTAGGFTITFNSYATGTLNPSLTVSAGSFASFNYIQETGGYAQRFGGAANGVGGTITGGTYTLTIFSETTAAVAYNASLATLSAAINALASVTARGGCTVTTANSNGAPVFGGTLDFSVAFSNAALTSNAASLTPASTIQTAITDTRGRVQTVKLTASASKRTITAPAHGVVNGNPIYLDYTGGSSAGITDFNVLNADSIELNILPTMAYASAASITATGKRTFASYSPGSELVASRKTTSFYLPGYTEGIATVGNIPKVKQDSGDALLTLILSGTGTITADVGNVEKWYFPIYQRPLVQVDVIDI